MDLEQAIDAPIDYSTEFVRRIAVLRDIVMSRIGIPLHHDPDMNYSAAQSLRLWLSETGEFAPGHDVAVYQIDVLVSSKADVFTTVALKKGDRSQWSQTPVSGNHMLANYAGQLRQCIEEQGYTFLPESELVRTIDGHFTELDGSPATLFHVLFSEMY